MTKGWYPQYIKSFVLQTCKKKWWPSTEMSNKGKKSPALVLIKDIQFNWKAPLPFKLVMIYRKK